jgi:hypothetical protein
MVRCNMQLCHARAADGALAQHRRAARGLNSYPATSMRISALSDRIWVNKSI